MGKHSHLKYKYNTISPNNELIIPFTNLQEIITILSSSSTNTNDNDNDVKEKLISQLSNCDFDSLSLINTDISLIVTSNEFLTALTNLLKPSNNESNAIMDNTIITLINIFITYIDNDEHQIHLNTFAIKTLFPQLNEMLTAFTLDKADFVNDNKEKIKLYTNVLDLTRLIVELTEIDSTDNILKNIIDKVISKIHIYNTIEYLVNEVKELQYRAFEVVYEIVSTKACFVNDDSSLQTLIMFISNELQNVNDKDYFMKACLECIMFYVNCVNNSYNKDVNVNCCKCNVDSIYNEVMNIKCVFDEVLKLKEFIEKYITNASNEIENDNNNDDDEHLNINETMTKDIEVIEQKVKGCYFYIKTFCDFIENINIDNQQLQLTTTIVNDDNDNDNDEDMEEEFEEINDDDVDNNSNNNPNVSFGIMIGKYLIQLLGDNIKHIFEHVNYIDIFVYLFSTNFQIDEFVINDFSKVLSLTDSLNEISTLSLTILNNTFVKFSLYIKHSLIIKSELIYNAISMKITTTEPTTSNCDFISLLLLTMRNFFEQTHYIPKQQLLTYKNLFPIMNKYIYDTFIKCNIIDIIAFVYTRQTLTQQEYKDNKELCNLLLTLFYNESHVEVLAHVVNAFMDIYQYDDNERDVILKNSTVVNIMFKAHDEFHKRVGIALKNKDIDIGTFNYIKETLFNMKRFVKYKFKVFKSIK
jgi:hypothetical protein